MAGTILNAGIGFITLGMLARQLSKEAFGSWVIFLTAMGFVEMIRAGFVYQALVKFVAGTPNPTIQKNYIRAAWLISTALTIGLLVLIFTIDFLFHPHILRFHFELFITKYPVVICLMLPINMTTWIFHARQQYKGMWLLNFLHSFPFLALIFFTENLTIQQVVQYFIYIRLGLAVVLILNNIYPKLVCLSFDKLRRTNFDKLRKIAFDKLNNTLRQAQGDNIRQAQGGTIGAMKEIWQFSRFTVLSTLGTNLLKSADVWFINAFGGPTMVALYNIPLKLIEVVEIPLRSWAMSAFPKLSALANGDATTFRATIWKEVGLFTLSILPFIGITFHFSEEIITLYAGQQFVSAAPVLKIFSIYLLLLPLDRYLGIALDSLNMPKINTLKVFLMVLMNITGDWLVLKQQLGLEVVASVTLLNATVGIVVGLVFLNKKLNNENEHLSLSATARC